jgi:hypothetical protein
MELNQQQYDSLRDSHAIRRYRLSIQEKCKIWIDEDFSLAMQIREELGITDPLTKFCSLCGIEYTHSIFKRLDQLYTQYENTHIQA